MERPKSITVLGTLNLVFAGLGLLATLLFVNVLLMGTELPKTAAPADTAAAQALVSAIKNNPAYALFMRVSLGLGLVACAVLATAGIGLLRLRPWARHLSIGWAVYSLIATVLTAIATYAWVYAPSNMAPTSGGSGITGLIYPVALLYFMSRDDAKSALTKRAGDSPQKPMVYAAEIVDP